jgi:hypothetical protein
MNRASLTSRKVAWTGIAVLTVMAALYLIIPLRNLPLHVSFIPNEGWNAHFSVMALGGGPLYPAADTFVFNNYPPLSFYIVGLTGLIFNDNILAGRIVSLAAMLVIAVNVAVTARHLGAGRLFSALAGVLFVGILAKTYVLYVGANEPQLLAHAIMTTGFAVMTASPRSIRHIAWASLLMVLAGFTKHNIFAMPLAVTTWYLQNDRRTLAHWLGFSVVFLAAGFAACWLLYGAAFFQQLMLPRAYSLYYVLTLLGWLQTIIIPLIIWIAFARQAPADPRIRMVSHLLVAGGLSFVINRLGGENVGVNALFDWVIGASIAAGVAISRIGEARLSRRYGPDMTQGLLVGALCLRMILLPQHQLINLLLKPHESKELRARDAAYRTEVAFVKAQPGPALCEDMAFCYRAGHASAYDAGNGRSIFRIGGRDIAVLQRQIASGQYRLIQVYADSELLQAARASGLRQRAETTHDFIFHAAGP